METKTKVDTNQVLEKLNQYVAEVWNEEPEDIKKLRSHALPPMGNMPCVFYANFNTFWLGENVQVHRLLAMEKNVSVSYLNQALAAILLRHAGRLAKWNLLNSVDILEYLAGYFNGQGAKSYEEFIQVTESILVVIDRINSWIDAMIPWNDLDTKLRLRS